MESSVAKVDHVVEELYRQLNLGFFFFLLRVFEILLLRIQKIN